MSTRGGCGRVIVFDLKSLFPDRTYQAFYESLEQVFDVTYYGPGYIPIDEIEEDLQRVIDKLGPFDACFINKSILRYRHEEHSRHFFDYDDRITCYLFNKKEFRSKKPKFGVNYNKLAQPSFLVAMLQDFYAFSDWYFKYFGEFPGYLLLPPPQTVSFVDELQDLKRERFYHLCTNDYLRFCEMHRERVIPLAHMMRDSEFIELNQEKYLKQVAVPGVLYSERKEILRVLRKNNIPVKDKLFLHKCLNVFLKARVLKHRHAIVRGSYRDLFIKLIAESLITYTEGSRLKIFLKKFIEIPAYGSLLMCDPFKNAADFGFESGKHYLNVNTENVVDVSHYYLKNIDEAFKIIESSQRMVRTYHSSSGLAKTFRQMVDLAMEGQLKGGSWHKGELLLKSTAKIEADYEIYA